MGPLSEKVRNFILHQERAYSHTHFIQKLKDKQTCTVGNTGNKVKRGRWERGEFEESEKRFGLFKVNTWPFADQVVIVLTVLHNPVCCQSVRDARSVRITAKRQDISHLFACFCV